MVRNDSSVPAMMYSGQAVWSICLDGNPLLRTHVPIMSDPETQKALALAKRISLTGKNHSVISSPSARVLRGNGWHLTATGGRSVQPPDS